MAGGASYGLAIRPTLGTIDFWMQSAPWPNPDRILKRASLSVDMLAWNHYVRNVRRQRSDERDPHLRERGGGDAAGRGRSAEQSADAGQTLSVALTAVNADGITPATSNESETIVDPALDDFTTLPFIVPVGGSQSSTTDADGYTTITLVKADGAVYATRDVDPDGDPIETVWYADGAPTQTLHQDYAESAAAGGSSRSPSDPAHCSQTRRPDDTAQKWLTQPITWRFRRDSTPSSRSLKTNGVEAALKSGHQEWNTNNNVCGVADRSVLDLRYGGGTTARFKGDQADGVSMILFGNDATVQRRCPSTHKKVLACATAWPGRSGEIIEYDIVVSRKWCWTTDGANTTNCSDTASGKFDVWSMTAHEVGHGIGFDHRKAFKERRSVMFGALYAGDTFNRTLGKLDALANNEKYPQP